MERKEIPDDTQADPDLISDNKDFSSEQGEEEGEPGEDENENEHAMQEEQGQLITGTVSTLPTVVLKT